MGREVDDSLARWIREATEAWPNVGLAPELFLQYAAERLAEGSLAEAMASIRAPDLYLAFGCFEQEAGALAYFESRYLPEVNRVWRSTRDRSVTLEDAKQMLRMKLLVRRDAVPPKIGDFAGTGDLRNWVRITASRLLADLALREREEPRDDDFFLALVSSKDTADVEHLKGLYRAEFKLIFAEAAQSLSFRDRNLLRYSLVEHLSIDEIGASYGVHRATGRALVDGRPRCAAVGGAQKTDRPPWDIGPRDREHLRSHRQSDGDHARAMPGQTGVTDGRGWQPRGNRSRMVWEGT